ncbi:hypothetical protein [Empedobacter tilapiae]|uniref:Uncharacterized protein n=1 Tax=Empedobacter tilapiae TaxID=2491114 RepID=A0A4Z1BQS4_9FLAO|nr:hypothetical protein [Empedobacter tilapiae]TGN24485.1 hypothetical protein E4J94_12595 [Empedobacter tilapiae]
MKKLFVIFFTLFYLVLASGFTQYTHLCKGSTKIIYSFTDTKNQNKDTPCPICSSKEKDLKNQKKNCCKHLSKLVKVNDSIKKKNSFDFSIKFSDYFFSNKTLGTVYDTDVLALAIQKNNTFTSSKIPFKGNPLHILHCVYRI